MKPIVLRDATNRNAFAIQPADIARIKETQYGTLITTDWYEPYLLVEPIEEVLNLLGIEEEEEAEVVEESPGE